MSRRWPLDDRMATVQYLSAGAKYPLLVTASLGTWAIVFGDDGLAKLLHSGRFSSYRLVDTFFRRQSA